MNNAMKQIDQALEQLATDLEHGQSETLRTYLAVMGRFSRYSLGNQLLIALQRPDATHVAGFQTWKRLGRWVKAGEHGIPIVAPIVRKKPRDEKNGDVETRTVVAFKGAYVFDITQTDGDPLPEFSKVTGDPAEQLDRLQEFVKAQGITLSFSDNLHGALGLSAGGRIIILNGLSTAEKFSTLAHEVAHARLHREHGDVVPHCVRELEAEAVAFAVCQAAGLDSGTASSDYVLLHQGDRQLLQASLERIRRTAAAIINGLQEERQRGSVQEHEPQRQETPAAEASAGETGNCRSQAA